MHLLRFKIFFQLLIVWGLISLIGYGGTEASMHLLVGVSRVEVTPGTPVQMAGYGSRKGPYTGIHDPLFVRVMALSQNDDQLVLVSTDNLGFYSGTDTFILEAIEKETGISTENIFLSAIHTHSAPRLTLDPEGGLEGCKRGTEAPSRACRRTALEGSMFGE